MQFPSDSPLASARIEERYTMRVHIENNALMRTVELFVEERPGWWLQVDSHDALRRVEVAEGVKPPVFLTLPIDVWEVITDEVPSRAEELTVSILSREQDRVDKLLGKLVEFL